MTEIKLKSVTEISPEKRDLILDYIQYSQRQGYAKSTIETRVSILKVLVNRGTILLDEESVKTVIALQDWTNKRKQNAVDTYSIFVKMKGMKWNPPFYREVTKSIFLPKENEINDLINETGPKTSAFLLLLKETGIRSGEASNLRFNDIDFVSKVIRITPEKGSNPRVKHVSDKLLNKLSYINSRNRTDDPKRIFSKSLRTTRRIFMIQRSKIANKLNNPRLLQIHFHTLRHWYATNLYHKTKNPVSAARAWTQTLCKY